MRVDILVEQRLDLAAQARDRFGSRSMLMRQAEERADGLCATMSESSAASSAPGQSLRLYGMKSVEQLTVTARGPADDAFEQ